MVKVGRRNQRLFYFLIRKTTEQRCNKVKQHVRRLVHVISAVWRETCISRFAVLCTFSQVCEHFGSFSVHGYKCFFQGLVLYVMLLKERC